MFVYSFGDQAIPAGKNLLLRTRQPGPTRAMPLVRRAPMGYGLGQSATDIYATPDPYAPVVMPPPNPVFPDAGVPTDIFGAPVAPAVPGGGSASVYAVQAQPPVAASIPPPIVSPPVAAPATTSALAALAPTPAPAAPAPTVSLASIFPSGFGAWFTSPSPIGSIPNWGFYGGGLVGILLIAKLASSRRSGSRRRR